VTRENGRHAAGRRTPADRSQATGRRRGREAAPPATPPASAGPVPGAGAGAGAGSGSDAGPAPTPAPVPVPGPGSAQVPVPRGEWQGTGTLQAPEVPRLTDGLELHGKYHGAGFARPMFTVRRVDGQVVQLSQLLYHVTCAIDGVRDSDGIAARVSATFAREISATDVEFLIEQKLRPVGVVASVGGTGSGVEPDAPRTDLLLVLKGRRTLLGPAAVGRIARALAWLHYAPVVALVLAGAVAMDVWLFFFHGAVSALLGVMDQPVLLLAVFGLAVVSLLFHEFGHASACHYGGARPGRIGFGIYLLWPSLFTDVTDVYRITRAGRLRTDLGGVYFNVIYMLAMTGLYGLTGQPLLLAAVYLGHFEVLEQLVPVVRLDGYYILSDLAGVPDLFGQIRPMLRRALPGRRKAGSDTGSGELTRHSRVLITGWMVTVIPLITAEILYMLWNLPALAATGLHSLVAQAREVSDAAAQSDPVGCGAAVLGFALLALPLAATVYLLIRLARMLARALGRTLGRRLGPVLGLGPYGRAGAALLRARGALNGRLLTGLGRRAVLSLAILGVATGLGTWLNQETADRSDVRTPPSPSDPAQAPPTLGLLRAVPPQAPAPVPSTRRATTAPSSSPAPSTRAAATASPVPAARATTRPAPVAPPTAPATGPAAPTVGPTPSAPPASPDPTTASPGPGHRSPPESGFPWDPGRGGRHHGGN
jgi:putative peptide zinc metalloprotease protein